ncbi:MAG: hypothetical protein VX701_07990 [Chloroflexota bacterium]|nr:hypothetical protein [Chloroflexota bacterium]
MKEKLRDQSRDNLARALNDIGVTASLAERNRTEEQVENSWYQRSLGIIDISSGPVKWINILKQDSGQHNPPRWWAILGIPDEKPISDQNKIQIKTVRKKTIPLFGKVVGVKWKGDDANTGLVSTLNRDESIFDLTKQIGDLEVKNQSDVFQGWTLIFDLKRFIRGNRYSGGQHWEIIGNIADRLLAAPRRL